MLLHYFLYILCNIDQRTLPKIHVANQINKIRIFFPFKVICLFSRLIKKNKEKHSMNFLFIYDYQ